jgi:hypothetical protein
MNTYTHNKNNNTIKSPSFIAISNSYKVTLIFIPWDHVNHYTGMVLWWYQMSHRNKMTIKVDLDTPKILVEAHGSRVECIHPDDRNIFSKPSRWCHIDITCKHVNRSHECYHGMSKEACWELDRTRYGWYRMIKSRTSNISRNKRNWLRR